MGNNSSTQTIGAFGKRTKKSINNVVSKKNHKKNVNKQEALRRKQKQEKKVKSLRNKIKNNKSKNHKKNEIKYSVLSSSSSQQNSNDSISHDSKSNSLDGNNENTNFHIVQPKTPILEPNIEENVSDIYEEPEEDNDSAIQFLPTLNQYLSRNKKRDGGGLSPDPTATTASLDRSLGMDSSFDSSALASLSSLSPQRNFEIDTTGMEHDFSTLTNVNSSGSGSGNCKYYHDDENDETVTRQIISLSTLYAIQEIGGENSRPSTANTNIVSNVNTSKVGANDIFDDDAFSDASSYQPDETLQGGKTNLLGGNSDNHSLDGSESSLLSTGSCTDFDNMSKGIHSNTNKSKSVEFDEKSKGVRSISEMSISSIPSFIINNKNKQRSREELRASQPISSASSTGSSMVSSTPSFHPSHYTYRHITRSISHDTRNRSIHTRISMKRSRCEGHSKSSRRPNASNAFETLPSHFIKTGLIRQTSTTLRDERFVKRRIEKLGPLYASKVHVSDFELLKKRDERNQEKREKMLDREGDGIEASLPSASAFPDGDDYFSVMMDSFDLFLKFIMEMCGVGMDQNIFELEEGCEELGEESNEEFTEEDDEGIEEEEEREEAAETCIPIDKPEPTILIIDGGAAILALGKFLQEKGWIDDAMYFFRHALYLFLLEVNVDEPSLLDEAEDCDGLFYAEIATKGSQVYSPVHEMIGTVLIKMGDVLGKNLEINEAMQAYRASQVFWDAYLTDHKASIQEQGKGNVDDLDLLNNYAAAVEGLALAHNRVGGVFTSKGDLTAAIKSFQEALDLQIDALGDDHLEVGNTLHNIGVCHRHDNDWDQAIQYYEKAYVIFEKKLGRNHLDTARTMHNIGGVYRRKNMYHEAIESFKEVLRVRRKLLGDDHPSVSIVLISIAAVLRRSGRKEEANKFYAAAIR